MIISPLGTILRTTGGCEGCGRPVTRTDRLDAPNPGPIRRMFCSDECREGTEVREALRPLSFEDFAAFNRDAINRVFRIPKHLLQPEPKK